VDKERVLHIHLDHPRPFLDVGARDWTMNITPALFHQNMKA